MSEAEVQLSTVLKRIEPKWQEYWDKNQSFRAANPGEPGSEKPKYYCLDMFPYPSGDGLHIGHPLGYTATDIISRYKRARGFNVLHPMGWDAFGLPAEQYAIKMGVHPATTTQKNIQNFKRQLKSLGFSFDWSREISTIDPSYYKWTQWLFKKLYERELAYQAEIAVNWCPALGTVLANDEIIDGKSERGGHPVERRPMRQWVLKITEYADRLLSDLDELDWPESTKEHQRNWIGRSVGAKIRFAVKGGTDRVEVFTTRPDTLFGVSFVAIAPEHALADKLAVGEHRQKVLDYAQTAARKTDLQRTDLSKQKTGVFTGSYVVHPLTGEEVPVWMADYILINYGTGSIMGVPAHDDRDLEFATQMKLAVKPVIDENGKLIHSGDAFNGLAIDVAVPKIIDALQTKNAGEKTITYRLRDWLFARQRYWGEPIPVIHVMDGPEKGNIRLLEDHELPLELPSVDRYEPTGTGESPLSAVSAWVNVKDPKTSAQGRRETNTMPGSAGSSWYFLRYMDSQNAQAPWSKEAEKYWQQVDLYLGGSEHAVGHLLYSRFWHKVFFDLGLVSTKEPFKRLVHQGMILGEDGEKMSKSRGNVINPDHVVAKYGADTLRLFEMFLGPLEKAKPWQTNSIEGVYRFLSRFWRLCAGDDSKLSDHVKDIPESEWPIELQQSLHKTIRQVTDDIEGLRFNTAISALMVLTNDANAFFNASQSVPKSLLNRMTLLLAPFAPHLGEEVWSMLGHGQSLVREPWPSFDTSKVVTSEMQLAVQINGKLRDTVKVSKTISEAELKDLVLSLESVKKWIEGKELRKFIYVKEKLVSLVV